MDPAKVEEILGVKEEPATCTQADMEMTGLKHTLLTVAQEVGHFFYVPIHTSTKYYVYKVVAYFVCLLFYHH